MTALAAHTLAHRDDDQGAQPSLGRGLIVHDSLVVRGGAERVMTTLAGAWPGSDWCVAAWDRGAFPPEQLSGNVTDLGVTATTPVWRTVAGLYAFRRAPVPKDPYAWALYSGFNAPAAVHQGLAERSVLYCHALPRFAYDLHDYYLEQLPRWQRPAFHGLVSHVRSRFESALSVMDSVLANSENVRARLKRYVGCDAEVVHPPVRATDFPWQRDRGYFLSTARLEDYKRVDRIVEAFRALPAHRLVVTSDGSQRKALEALAADAPNISFTGSVSDAELIDWIGGALATVYLPQDEDFGLSPVESMAAGKPVLGVAEGGLLETVIPGQTGWLLSPDPSVEEIRAAVVGIEPAEAHAMRAACEHQAHRFGLERFLDGVGAALLGQES